MSSTFLVALSLVALLGAAATAQPGESSPPAPPEGVALAIVFDTSGSMLDPVRDPTGRSLPKYQVASRALATVLDRLETVASGGEKGPRPLEAGLFTFKGEQGAVAVPFGPLDTPALRKWLRDFARPVGATPLGDTVRLAARAALKSPHPNKHVLVITDGENTAGPTPASVLPTLQRTAENAQTIVFYHFIAFDVDARVFAPLKQLGVTVVGAANAPQLNEQLEFIIEQKVLLESETPPAKTPKQP